MHDRRDPHRVLAAMRELATGGLIHGMTAAVVADMADELEAHISDHDALKKLVEELEYQLRGQIAETAEAHMRAEQSEGDNQAAQARISALEAENERLSEERDEWRGRAVDRDLECDRRARKQWDAEAQRDALVEALKDWRNRWDRRSQVAEHAVRKGRAQVRSGMQMRHADEVVRMLDNLLALQVTTISREGASDV